MKLEDEFLSTWPLFHTQYYVLIVCSTLGWSGLIYSIYVRVQNNIILKYVNYLLNTDTTGNRL